MKEIRLSQLNSLLHQQRGVEHSVELAEMMLPRTKTASESAGLRITIKSRQQQIRTLQRQQLLLLQGKHPNEGTEVISPVSAPTQIMGTEIAVSRNGQTPKTLDTILQESRREGTLPPWSRIALYGHNPFDVHALAKQSGIPPARVIDKIHDLQRLKIVNGSKQGFAITQQGEEIVRFRLERLHGLDGFTRVPIERIASTDRGRKEVQRLIKQLSSNRLRSFRRDPMSSEWLTTEEGMDVLAIEIARLPSDIKEKAQLDSKIAFSIAGDSNLGAPSYGEIASWIVEQIDQRANGARVLGREKSDRVLEFLMNFEEHVLFEDEHMLVLNKPAGINSHHTEENRVGLEEIARYVRGYAVALAHRLDRDTTGVLVLGKTEEALDNLDMQFANKTQSDLKKVYRTVLEGRFSSGETIIARVPIAKLGKKMKVVSEQERRTDPTARTSLSYFTPLEAYKAPDGTHKTLTQVQIVTGRQHQIRVVAADHLRHPVVGDRDYNPNPRGASRPLLHAHQLSIMHPITKMQMLIEAPIPQDMIDFLSRLDQEEPLSASTIVRPEYPMLETPHRQDNTTVEDMQSAMTPSAETETTPDRQSGIMIPDESTTVAPSTTSEIIFMDATTTSAEAIGKRQVEDISDYDVAVGIVTCQVEKRGESIQYAYDLQDGLLEGVLDHIAVSGSEREKALRHKGRFKNISRSQRKLAEMFKNLVAGKLDTIPEKLAELNMWIDGMVPGLSWDEKALFVQGLLTTDFIQTKMTSTPHNKH